MLVLLSPAKKLDYKNPVQIKEYSIPRLLEKSQELINNLKKLQPKEIADLMHLSPKLSDLNYERYQRYETPFTTKNTKQAIFAFDGEAYAGFDAYSLTLKEAQQSQQQIRILSGLYGLLKPLDLIYPYRLEMGTKFSPKKSQKNLYEFWGMEITDMVNQDAQKHNYIINLASNEYFKALKKANLQKPIITPSFKDEKNGVFKTVMVYAKRSRGAMARYIVKNNIKTLGELKKYNVGGYSFESSMSDDTNWTFVR